MHIEGMGAAMLKGPREKTATRIAHRESLQGDDISKMDLSPNSVCCLEVSLKPETLVVAVRNQIKCTNVSW